MKKIIAFRFDFDFPNPVPTPIACAAQTTNDSDKCAIIKSLQQQHMDDTARLMFPEFSRLIHCATGQIPIEFLKDGKPIVIEDQCPSLMVFSQQHTKYTIKQKRQLSGTNQFHISFPETKNQMDPESESDASNIWEVKQIGDTFSLTKVVDKEASEAGITNASAPSIIHENLTLQLSAEFILRQHLPNRFVGVQEWASIFTEGTKIGATSFRNVTKANFLPNGHEPHESHTPLDGYGPNVMAFYLPEGLLGRTIAPIRLSTLDSEQLLQIETYSERSPIQLSTLPEADTTFNVIKVGEEKPAKASKTPEPEKTETSSSKASESSDASKTTPETDETEDDSDASKTPQPDKWYLVEPSTKEAPATTASQPIKASEQLSLMCSFFAGNLSKRTTATIIKDIHGLHFQKAAEGFYEAPEHIKQEVLFLMKNFAANKNNDSLLIPFGYFLLKLMALKNFKALQAKAEAEAKNQVPKPMPRNVYQKDFIEQFPHDIDGSSPIKQGIVTAKITKVCLAEFGRSEYAEDYKTYFGEFNLLTDADLKAAAKTKTKLTLEQIHALQNKSGVNGAAGTFEPLKQEKKDAILNALAENELRSYQLLQESQSTYLEIVTNVTTQKAVTRLCLTDYFKGYSTQLLGAMNALNVEHMEEALRATVNPINKQNFTNAKVIAIINNNVLEDADGAKRKALIGSIAGANAEALLTDDVPSKLSKANFREFVNGRVDSSGNVSIAANAIDVKQWLANKFVKEYLGNGLDTKIKYFNILEGSDSVSFSTALTNSNNSNPTESALKNILKSTEVNDTTKNAFINYFSTKGKIDKNNYIRLIKDLDTAAQDLSRFQATILRKVFDKNDPNQLTIIFDLLEQNITSESKIFNHLEYKHTVIRDLYKQIKAKKRVIFKYNGWGTYLISSILRGRGKDHHAHDAVLAGSADKLESRKKLKVYFQNSNKKTGDEYVFGMRGFNKKNETQVFFDEGHMSTGHDNKIDDERGFIFEFSNGWVRIKSKINGTYFGKQEEDDYWKVTRYGFDRNSAITFKLEFPE